MSAKSFPRDVRKKDSFVLMADQLNSELRAWGLHFRKCNKQLGSLKLHCPALRAVCAVSGLTALEITSGLVQAVAVTDMLVLNGWHLLPSCLNAAGKGDGRHSSAFLLQDFLQAQALLASGNNCSPSQEGSGHLPCAHTCPGEPNCFLSSLTAGESSIRQVPLGAFLTSAGKKVTWGARFGVEVECWAPLLGASQLQRPWAPSLQRGMAAGNTLHTSTRKKFGGFSDSWQEQSLSNTLQRQAIPWCKREVWMVLKLLLTADCYELLLIWWQLIHTWQSSVIHGNLHSRTSHFLCLFSGDLGCGLQQVVLWAQSLWPKGQRGVGGVLRTS